MLGIVFVFLLVMGLSSVGIFVSKDNVNIFSPHQVNMCYGTIALPRLYDVLIRKPMHIPSINFLIKL